DPETGRTKVRLGDVHSTRYAIARRYMIRLRRDDFQDLHELAKLAATCRLSPQEFPTEVEYPVEDEPPALVLEAAPTEVVAPPAAASSARPRRARRSAR